MNFQQKENLYSTRIIIKGRLSLYKIAYLLRQSQLFKFTASTKLDHIPPSTRSADYTRRHINITTGGYHGGDAQQVLVGMSMILSGHRNWIKRYTVIKYLYGLNK